MFTQYSLACQTNLHKHNFDTHQSVTDMIADLGTHWHTDCISYGYVLTIGRSPMISIIDSWIALIEEWLLIRGLTLMYFHGRSTLVRCGCLRILGSISSDDFHSHFQHNENVILSWFIFCSSERTFAHALTALVSCALQHCSDWLIKNWIRWPQRKSSPPQFQSEHNDLLKEFKFYFDGIMVGEVGSWSECFFRSLLQFLVWPINRY